MKHQLAIRLAGDNADLVWANAAVRLHHYLHTPPVPISRPHCYIVDYFDERVGLIMVAQPHAPRCRGHWGYKGLITQWQVLDLCRIWLDPIVQAGGALCGPGASPGFIDRQGVWRPAVATWAIKEVLARVQQDRISLWPPVYLEQPYHIRRVISYHDPRHHRGTIYKQSGAKPMYTSSSGDPVPGPSGKYGWYWDLPEPTWTWQDIEIARPRTMRMAI